MLKIEIVEPHLMDKKTLHNVGVFLLALAGHEVVNAPAPPRADFIEKATREEPEINPSIDGRLADPEFVAAQRRVPMPPPAEPLLTPNQVMGVEPFPVPTTGTCRAPVEIEVDANGLPWDGRIHARTKTKVADGSWKKMRGVHDHVVAKVEAELRQAMNAPVAPVVMDVPAPATVEMPADAAKVFAPPAVLPATRVADDMAMTAPIPPAPITFPALVQKIAGYLSTNKLVQKELIEIVSSLGLPSLPLASTRPDLIPTIEAMVDAKVMERAA